MKKMIIDFFMAMRPPTTTFQAKQINWKNKAIYESSEAKSARQKLEAHLAKHVPRDPILGPVRMTSIWCFEPEGEFEEVQPKTDKPDLDNLNKLLADSMTKLGFWKDDCQVFSHTQEKYWSQIPGIYIKLEEVDLDEF